MNLFAGQEHRHRHREQMCGQQGKTEGRKRQPILGCWLAPSPRRPTTGGPFSANTRLEAQGSALGLSLEIPVPGRCRASQHYCIGHRLVPMPGFSWSHWKLLSNLYLKNENFFNKALKFPEMCREKGLIASLHADGPVSFYRRVQILSEGVSLLQP